jgi:ribosomal protein S18 acetylase RimI-like enzyme
MKEKIFDGKKIIIKKLSEKDLKRVGKFRDFINSLIEEDAQILCNKKPSLEEELNWLKGALDRIKKQDKVYLFAEHNGQIIGSTDIGLMPFRENHVGDFGIMIKKGYRGIGLGTYLMGEILKLAKKDLKPKPKFIKLGVFSTNKPAFGLYKKMGFKKVAKMPKFLQHKGKLVDEFVMLIDL